jgi:hypothetical protein
MEEMRKDFQSRWHVSCFWSGSSPREGSEKVWADGEASNLIYCYGLLSRAPASPSECSKKWKWRGKRKWIIRVRMHEWVDEWNPHYLCDDILVILIWQMRHLELGDTERLSHGTKIEREAEFKLSSAIGFSTLSCYWLLPAVFKTHHIRKA